MRLSGRVEGRTDGALCVRTPSGRLVTLLLPGPCDAPPVVDLDGVVRCAQAAALYCPAHSSGLQFDHVGPSVVDKETWRDARPVLAATMRGVVTDSHVADDARYAALLRRVARALLRASAVCAHCAGCVPRPVSVRSLIAECGSEVSSVGVCLPSSNLNDAERPGISNGSSEISCQPAADNDSTCISRQYIEVKFGVYCVLENVDGQLCVRDATGTLPVTGRVDTAAVGSLVVLLSWRCVRESDVGLAYVFVERMADVASFGAPMPVPASYDVHVCTGVHPLAISNSARPVLSSVVHSVRLATVSHERHGDAKGKPDAVGKDDLAIRFLRDEARPASEHPVTAEMYALLNARPGVLFGAARTGSRLFPLRLAESAVATHGASGSAVCVSLPRADLRWLEQMMQLSMPREVSPHRAVDSHAAGQVVPAVIGLVTHRRLVSAADKANALWQSHRIALPRLSDTLVLTLAKDTEHREVQVVLDPGGRVRLPLGVVPGARVAVTHLRVQCDADCPRLVSSYATAVFVLPLDLHASLPCGPLRADDSLRVATQPPRPAQVLLHEALQQRAVCTVEGRFLRLIRTHHTDAGIQHSLLFYDGTAQAEAVVRDRDLPEAAPGDAPETRVSHRRGQALPRRIAALVAADWRVTLAPLTGDAGFRLQRLRIVSLERVSYADLVYSNRFLID